MHHEDKKPLLENNTFKYISLGTQILVLLGLAVWAGITLDKKWHTTPLFLIVFPVLALVLNFYQLYKQLSKPNKKK
jgi:F0F1-type ATP synthase assembly protein I